MNSIGVPAMRFCGLERAPTLTEVTIVCQAFRLWYLTFRPNILAAKIVVLDPEAWLRQLITGAPSHPKDCRTCGGRPYRNRTVVR